jgi:hypothetical protein
MDNIDQTLAELQQKVSQFVVSNNENTNLNFPILKKKIIIYFIIPIIIFSILLLWKPSFITKEIKKDGSPPTQKINFVKLLTTTVIISGALSLTLILTFKMS